MDRAEVWKLTAHRAFHAAVWVTLPMYDEGVTEGHPNGGKGGQAWATLASMEQQLCPEQVTLQLCVWFLVLRWNCLPTGI